MAGEARGSCVVNIGGGSYDRMLSMTLRRNKMEGTCDGTIVLSWPGAEAYSGGALASAFSPCADGTIMLDGQLAAVITLDTRISKGTPKHYELTIQFRGNMSRFVDSSPDHDTGQLKGTPGQILQELMKGGQLIDRSGGGKMIDRFIVSEGETVERAGRRVARDGGSLNFWEPPEGGWILEKKGQGGGGGQVLQLGKNFTQWSVKQDASPRFAKLEMFGNGIPTDEKYGKEVESIFSKEMRNFGGGGGSCERLLRVAADGDHDNGSMQDRGMLEGGRRSGQGLNVTLRMSTWSDDGGKLWRCGNKHMVIIPVDDVADSLEIIETIFELTPDSRSATLTLMDERAMGGGGGGGGNVLYDDHMEPQATEEPPAYYTPPPPPPTEVPQQQPEPAIAQPAVEGGAAEPGWTSQPATSQPTQQPPQWAGPGQPLLPWPNREG